jgi:cell division septation protein DedD
MPGADALAREVARWNETSRPVEFTDAAIDTVARISRGVPRMVNVLCDRALEAAFAAQTRTVDAPDIERAARLLPLHDAGGAPASDAPAASAPAIDHLAANTPVIETPAIETPAFAASAAAEPETRELATAEARMAPRTDAHEAMFAQSAPATEDIDRPAPSGAGRYAAVAAVVILGAALAVFSLRTLGGGRGTTGDAGGASAPPLQTPRDETPAAAPQPAPAAQSAPASQPTPAPESAPATAAQPEPVAPLPAATPNPPAAAPAAATDGSFEIVIASFRTETRAAQVVAELTALGHQARARVIGEWQQVVAGPFATRAAAEEAQRQLDSQGYTATHIVPAS